MVIRTWGNLYGDVKSLTDKNGKPFAAGSFAQKNKKGEPEHVDFIVYGDRMDYVLQGKKGWFVCIEGEITLKSYNTRQGEAKAAYQMQYISELFYPGVNNGNENHQNGQNNQSRPQNQPQYNNNNYQQAPASQNAGYQPPQSGYQNAPMQQPPMQQPPMGQPQQTPPMNNQYNQQPQQQMPANNQYQQAPQQQMPQQPPVNQQPPVPQNQQAQTYCPPDDLFAGGFGDIDEGMFGG